VAPATGEAGTEHLTATGVLVGKDFSPEDPNPPPSQTSTGVGANTGYYRVHDDGSTTVGSFPYSFCGLVGWLPCSSDSPPACLCAGYGGGCITER
jgi:hypothetical protein